MAFLNLSPDVLAGVDALAGQKLGVRYLTERGVRRSGTAAPIRRVG